MKKKWSHAIFRVEIRKWGRIMLVNLILVLLSGVSLYAQNESSRQQRITAKYQNKTILEVLEDLKAKTGYTFVHKQNDISSEVKITETFTNATLDDVLKKVLTAHGYDYSIESKVIVIKKKPKAQESLTRDIITVKGRVVDEKGNPMPGVSVVINQTTRGVATDHRGNYDILVRTDDVLKFSFIGYKDATIPVEGKSTINLALEPTEETLEEVTVVAYGEQKRESVTGSITTVRPSSLKSSNSDLTASFVGRIPGMIGYLKGGKPGALTEAELNTQFSIRGITSFGNNANTAPLILMDGVEVSVLDLSRIDPEDIDSFSVLKDASATAMYGARGANGVILVSTKKGVEGSVYTAFRYEAIASMPTRKIDVVDPITYMKAYNEALQTRDPLAQPKYTADRIANTGSDRFPEWLYPANDWYDLLFKNVAINHHLGLSVRGGTKIMQYYASIGHNYDEGMLKTDRLNQFNVNIRNNTTSLRINMNIDMTPTAKLVINSNSTYDSYHGPLADVTAAYGLAFNANPVDYAAVYPADDTYVFPHIRYGYETINSKNPYASIQSGYVERSRFATTNRVEYIQNLSALLKGLEIRANVSLYKESYDSTPFQTVPYQYRLLDYNHQTGKHTLEQLLEGDKNLKVDPNNKVTIDETQLAGEFRLYYNGNWGNHSVSYTGLFNLSQFASSQGRSLFDAIKHRNMGLSMRLSYGFKERYYLEGSFGYNGSERFAKNNRFGFFPSVGISYVISKEPFMSGTSHWLSFLKLRGSYGKVGNDGIGTGSGIGENGRYVYLPNIGKDSQDHYIIKVSSINSIYPLVSDSRTL
ncbi:MULTISPECIES: SusC/RagA family TonB-linked outer membrane protein [Butyricimonas]|nr:MULTISPECIES: SusC/RagA family TonB-linked outer membrane protein [Butyricimonas]